MPGEPFGPPGIVYISGGAIPLINQLYLVEKLCIESAHKQLTCNKEETIK